MTKLADKVLADPTLHELGTGTEFELRWSRDETMTTLYITRPALGGKIQKHKLELSAVELDELRAFIGRNIL